MSSVFVIAEAGVNHNGSKDLAFKLVDAAILAGADAIKFQTFKAENLVTRDADKATYQKQATGANESQFEMLKRLELSHDAHHELMSYCNERGILFLSTAFDLDSLRFLVDDLKLNTLKIPSGEITNGPLLLAHAMTGIDLILSTGMATLGEVEEALGVLAYGLSNDSMSKLEPSKTNFQKSYFSEKGQQILREKVTVLHCTTEYPAPLDEINLNAMTRLSNSFGLKVGYSDHSEGITVAIAAVAMGATLIEKHFTLDRSLPGPDHSASLEPDELAKMIKSIRTTEQVMGSGVKGPVHSELENRPIARKSLVASKAIQAGEKYTQDNLTIKRPGTGISPMKYWDFIGKTAQQSYLEDELIK